MDEKEDAAREEEDVRGRTGRRRTRTISCGIDSKVVDKEASTSGVNEGDEDEDEVVEVIMSDV